MELSPGWVGAVCTVASLIGGAATAWINASLGAVKSTQKVLFEKLDKQAADLAAHKLHTAETYVNRQVLTEQLAPINRALEKIDDDLREMRKE